MTLYDVYSFPGMVLQARAISVDDAATDLAMSVEQVKSGLGPFLPSMDGNGKLITVHMAIYGLINKSIGE